MDVRQVLVGLGAYGLPVRGNPPPADPPDALGWRQLRNGICYQRLAGLAVAAADAGALVLTDEQREELESDHLEAMAHVLRLERTLLRVHEVLGDAGVPFLVLKGSAVAHLDYADPALRAFGDNDVLIPTEGFATAIDALLASGYRRPSAEVGPGFDVRFGKGATLVAGDGRELDVHRTFAMGPFGLLVDLAELWEEPEPFEVGGRPFRALGTEQRYLHACYHAVVGNPDRRVLPYRDVAEMLLHGAYDVDRLRALAVSWGAEVVLARAVTDTWDVLGLTGTSPLLTWAREREPTGRDARMMRVYGPGTSYAAKAVAALEVLPRWRDRVAFVRLLALPGDGYVRAHGRSRVGWVLRGLRRAAVDRRRARSAAR